MPGENKTVLLCVTGCIAAYKSCEILRLLQKSGYRVKVLMSEHATHFVDPVTFRALSHEKVAVDLFDDPQDPIHHISLAQEADVVLVAPATANIIAKMAHGIADDLLSTTLLATRAPIVVAPAMNVGMWEAAATQENLRVLTNRGVTVVQPGSGYLACGEVATGRLAEPEQIANETIAALDSSDELAEESILITAGPTHEPIDPVRYIANRSSGKMGIALARQAARMGAEVTLVLGPTDEPVPAGVQVMRVTTAREMFDAATEIFEQATIAILAAAVADYTPAHPADHKLKKALEPLDRIELTKTADILASLSAHKGNRTVIGFAAETNSVVEYAQAKLERKGCDAILANDVSSSNTGFGSNLNRAWWITNSSTEDLGTLDKDELARIILLKTREFKRCQN